MQLTFRVGSHHTSRPAWPLPTSPQPSARCRAWRLCRWRAVEKLGDGGHELRGCEWLIEHDAVRHALGCPVLGVRAAHVDDRKSRVGFPGLGGDVPPGHSTLDVNVGDQCLVLLLAEELESLL